MTCRSHSGLPSNIERVSRGYSSHTESGMMVGAIGKNPLKDPSKLSMKVTVAAELDGERPNALVSQHPASAIAFQLGPAPMISNRRVSFDPAR
jgi:hypothetical protein